MGGGERECVRWGGERERGGGGEGLVKGENRMC